MTEVENKMAASMQIDTSGFSLSLEKSLYFSELDITASNAFVHWSWVPALNASVPTQCVLPERRQTLAFDFTQNHSIKTRIL